MNLREKAYQSKQLITTRIVTSELGLQWPPFLSTMWKSLWGKQPKLSQPLCRQAEAGFGIWPMKWGTTWTIIQWFSFSTCRRLGWWVHWSKASSSTMCPMYCLTGRWTAFASSRTQIELDKKTGAHQGNLFFCFQPNDFRFETKLAIGNESGFEKK